MKLIVTITEAEAGLPEGWNLADVLDWARRNPEECTLIAGCDVLHVDAIEVAGE